ncbi:hypothetical protein B0H63DRAFT_469968 [Podospora didyma]|uniref:FAD-binding PCMH-type domain-containing protein n=1 Tax=Podospora didyma TaxID=330526 RepID=A0AAE0NTY5_9PEZI|nr:hypothetical protein B0H63DRAFT_469968 [Podospora didyma]
MHSSFLSTYLLTSSFVFLAASIPTRSCKAIPGDPDWPLDAAWANLNKTVSGRLIRPVPPGAVCHRDQSFTPYDAGKCSAVQAAWTDWNFHTADLVSTGKPNWSNDTCLPFEGYPCDAAGYPTYVINATTTAHVQAGILFANTYNLRLVIHSTGHDLLGRSNAPNSLSVNTHHLKTLTVHDSFTPRECDPSNQHPAVTLGAGSQMAGVYSALAEHNLTIVGGTGETVSLGGYISGGGYGVLTPWLGLAVDQVLEVEVALPNGLVVVGNACQNQDLLWAARGGGGSTFGVLLSATVKSYPSPEIVSVSFIAVASSPYSPSTASLVAYLLSQFPYFASHNMSGALFGGPNQTVFTANPASAFSLGLDLMDSQDEGRVRDIFRPVEDHVRRQFPEFFVSVSTTASPSWIEYYQTHKDNTGAGRDELITSRLIGGKALTADTGALQHAVDVLVEKGDLIIGTLVGGVGLFNADGAATSVQPGWRTAILHLITTKTWPPLNQTALDIVKTDIEEMTIPLRALAPDTGAYINEASALDPDWRRLYWGDNYKRLLEIKRTIDPTDVFWCPLCVGNERWQEINGRVCPVDCRK